MVRVFPDDPEAYREARTRAARGEMIAITPVLHDALKLAPKGACDYCGAEAGGALFACMGETRCTFVHGCARCIDAHHAFTHRGETRYAARERSS
ncbi:MAG: hypothetical protein IVW56_04610 [Candidatus Binataceae bacterium]|nr:hypothetical protein [Candidatus Binataceae bacterium]